MDETGLWVAGVTIWLHVICDGTLTCYRLGSRGDIRVAYVGTAVHDRFASYLSQLLPDEAPHGICNAYLLRNLEEIVEPGKVPDGWAARLQRPLLGARDAAVHWCDATGRKRRQILLDLLRLDPDELWPDPIPSYNPTPVTTNRRLPGPQTDWIEVPE